MVKLELNGSDNVDKYAFELLQQAHRARGGAEPTTQKLTKAERRQDGLITRAFKNISDSSSKGTTPEPPAIDGRLRELKAGVQYLELEQPEYERLQKFFDADAMAWSTLICDETEEISQRLARALAASSVKEADESKSPKPTLVEKAN